MGHTGPMSPLLTEEQNLNEIGYLAKFGLLKGPSVSRKDAKQKYSVKRQITEHYKMKMFETKQRQS